MPKEVIGLICSHLPTTQDLFSMIKTSRACRDAFSIQRTEILFAVIRNELSEDSWHAVLGILNAPRFEDL